MSDSRKLAPNRILKGQMLNFGVQFTNERHISAFSRVIEPVPDHKRVSGEFKAHVLRADGVLPLRDLIEQAADD
jgi:hypothetical protein